MSNGSIPFQFVGDKQVSNFARNLSSNDEMMKIYIGDHYNYDAYLIANLSTATREQFDIANVLIPSENAFIYGPSRVIYCAIKDLFLIEGLNEVDPRTIRNYIEEKGETNELYKGMTLEDRLTFDKWIDEYDWARNTDIKFYARAIANRYRRQKINRRLIEANNKVLNEQSDKVLNEELQSILSEIRTISAQEAIDCEVETNVKKLSECLLDNPGDSDIANTGIGNLDAYLSIAPAEIISIVGRTGEGKSALGTQILVNMAKQFPEHDFLFFSKELSQEIMLDRIYQLLSGVDVSSVRIKDEQVLTDGNLIPLSQAKTLLDESKSKMPDNLYLYSLGFNSIGDIWQLAKAHSLKHQRPIQAIAVDHFHAFDFGEPKTEYQTQAREANLLLDMVKSENLSCILMLQARKQDSQQISFKELNISDIEGTGRLGHISSSVIAIHNPNRNGKAKLMVRKNRRKVCAEIECRFNGARLLFESQ